MAVDGPAASAPADRVTFWFGCNMLRHAEMIRLSMRLLERVGYDVSAAGGPGYCCGTGHDHQPHAASNMAARTVSRFNEAAVKEGRGTVVTWCPSCHMHMRDIMQPGNAAQFDISHVTELLVARRDRLLPLLKQPVKRKILLHQHMGFATHVAINPHVQAILTAIEGLTLIPGPAHPGHMCSALAAVPGALSIALHGTWEAARAQQCDTVGTIFHSCHRELAAAAGSDGISVRNWVHLLAEAMELEAGDAYLDWRTGGAPDLAAIERVVVNHYKTLIEPELRKPSPLAPSAK